MYLGIIFRHCTLWKKSVKYFLTLLATTIFARYLGVQTGKPVKAGGAGKISDLITQRLARLDFCFYFHVQVTGYANILNHPGNSLQSY
jgi:hypothetical protein